MSKGKPRLTTHRGRTNKKGKPFNPKHNDRNFDLNAPTAAHIDKERTKDNKVFLYDADGNAVQGKTIEQHEIEVYEQRFGTAIAKQNAKNDAKRQSCRNKSIYDIYTGEKTCPEEIIFQIGRADEENQVDRATAEACFGEWIEWHRKTYPQIHIMDVAFHYDETSDHAQIRQCYIGHDKNGDEVESQNKALTEMQVEIADKSKQSGQYNNKKMTYTKATRDKLIAICKSHGIEIEEVPKEASKSGLDLMTYQTQQEQAKLAQIQQEQAAALETIDKLTADVIDTIKPKKVGLFGKSKDEYVMSEETKDTVLNALQEIRTTAKKVTDTNKATDKAREEAEEARKQADLSKARQQEEIQKAARELVQQVNRREIKAMKAAEKAKQEAEADRIQAEGELQAAKQEREKAEQMKKHEKEIINQKVTEGIADIRAEMQEQVNTALEQVNKEGIVKELRAALGKHNNPLTGENSLDEFNRKKQEKLLEGINIEGAADVSHRRSKTRSDDDYSRG